MAGKLATYKLKSVGEMTEPWGNSPLNLFERRPPTVVHYSLFPTAKIGRKPTNDVGLQRGITILLE